MCEAFTQCVESLPVVRLLAQGFALAEEAVGICSSHRKHETGRESYTLPF
jgi:hypothetical protein